jgi:hypothetical protein
MRSKSSWRCYINTLIDFFDISPRFYSLNISETGLCLRPQAILLLRWAQSIQPVSMTEPSVGPNGEGVLSEDGGRTQYLKSCFK